MRQDIGNDTTMTPREADDFCSDIVPGPEMALNIGFPIQAAFAQLEGYARNLAAQSDDPHCKMQLERVRTAALDLAASITSEMLTSPTGHTLKEATRRTNQPALIDPSQLEALLHMAGPQHRERLLSQLAVDLSTADDVLRAGMPNPATRDATCRAMSVAEAIGATRAARLAQDLLDGVDQGDSRKCSTVAELLHADLAELIQMLADLTPAANTCPAE